MGEILARRLKTCESGVQKLHLFESASFLETGLYSGLQIDILWAMANLTHVPAGHPKANS